MLKCVDYAFELAAFASMMTNIGRTFGTKKWEKANLVMVSESTLETNTVEANPAVLHKQVNVVFCMFLQILSSCVWPGYHMSILRMSNGSSVLSALMTCCA